MQVKNGGCKGVEPISKLITPNEGNRARFFYALYYLLPSVLFCAVASLVNTTILKINESFFVLWLYVNCNDVYL